MVEPHPRLVSTGQHMVVSSSLCHSTFSHGLDDPAYHGPYLLSSCASSGQAFSSCTQPSCKSPPKHIGQQADKTSNYFADAYETYSSSAQASQGFARNILSGVFPLFAKQMVSFLFPLWRERRAHDSAVRGTWLSPSLDCGGEHRSRVADRPNPTDTFRQEAESQEQDCQSDREGSMSPLIYPSWHITAFHDLHC